MRGLGTALGALLLLVPSAVLAVKPSLGDKKSLHVSPAHKLLTVGVGLDTSKTSKPAKSLVLTLDIRESKHACSSAKVRVDGYLLSQDDNGAGQGTFATQDGTTVTASWNFTCMERVRVPWDQDLTMTIMSVDGKSIPDTNLFASFRQRAPVKVFEVGGDSIFYTSEGTLPVTVDHDVLLDEIESLRELPQFDDSIEAEIKTMQELKHKIDKLEELLESKELLVMEKLGFKTPNPTSSCKDFSCVFQSFSHKAQTAQSDLCDAMDSWWKAVFGCAADEEPASPYHPEAADERQPDRHGKDGHRFHKNGHGHHRHRHHRRPHTRIPLLLIVAETALTFGLCFYYILRCIRQRIQNRRERGRGACRFFRRAGSWWERRAQKKARRAARKEAIRSFFRKAASKLFNGRGVDDEEKRGMPSPTATSMEDEIASFREAASVVSDLISVEEGRMSTDKSSLAKPAAIIDDDVPPAYDSDVEDEYAPMIANGPRYHASHARNGTNGKPY